MASSSTYDVYLSFRDPDKGITFDLYDALMRGGLKAYLGDTDLLIGDGISPTLLKAIQRSRICVIVISQNYVSSSWCLAQLVWIMELWRREDRLVLPVFYNVDPSDVRKQKRYFGEALEKHRRFGRRDQTTMLDWREALTQVANICGWVANNYRDDIDLIIDIVKSIQSKGLPTRLNISIYPLRYDMCDEYLEVFLQAGPQEVVIVGICGPGQMGKTALARVMYDQILHNFDGGCFLAEVAKRSDQPNYLVRLQETLLSEILLERNVKISNTRMGRDLIAQNLCSKRVLVVLDNVDNLKQIHALVGDRKFFGPGSKIIITARDVHLHLLELFGVDQFILAQGRPLPENVAGIWEPYQRSRCVVAGLKEYIETFNHQRLDKLRNLQAVLLQERQKNATQGRLISDLLKPCGEGSASNDN
ncbi:PREDICTED: TMV resistance protein N-like [Fragaria vesca subsp. vesca]|uniref:TMV resistance protein N-like n=1 Tax=Fragaria vesca subsp. vesca TaxID=101020 RepID=UPI0002C36670|nr:PREDICTED: TMV resistance protein N-like [Fragaria vesca subsp. vesca]